MLHKIAQRILSETEEKTVEHFRYYYDNKKCFALIGDYVVAVLSDDNSADLEKLKQEASDNMVNVLNTPPDFGTYVMDDQFGLVEMNYGIYAVSQEQLSDSEIKSGRMTFAAAYPLRCLCMEACRNGTVIAIYDAEIEQVLQDGRRHGKESGMYYNN